MIYRTDIDGLRAIAVISVILFHLGYLPNGYLGVDVFFVISGYLITSIVYKESQNGNFSIKKFYERRLRRIIPLLLFVTGVAFLLGVLWMLPDDLENLSQSVLASNLSANNILMYITSSDYWAVKNDYKPLMHTWSLGIEEQFYLFYPLLFYLLRGPKLRYAFITLLLLSSISLLLFLFNNNPSAKFYFLQYRFFELGIGGISAVYFKEAVKENVRNSAILYFFLVALFVLIIFSSLPNDINLILIVFCSAGILVLGKTYFVNGIIYNFLTSNKVVSLIGKISFSLYMWHQVIFAFARYSFFEEITKELAVLLILLTFFLSLLTYHYIENPFRKRSFIGVNRVLQITSFIFILTTGISFYVYYVGGIIKDYPSLGLYRNKVEQVNFLSRYDNIHISYNEKVRGLDKKFDLSKGKRNVLVIGNSYGRDVVNILLEFDKLNVLQVRYFDINRAFKDPELASRIGDSDIVVLAARDFIDTTFISELEEKYKTSFDSSKFWMVGTKDFGYSNGIHFAKINKGIDFRRYRTSMKKGVNMLNSKLKLAWGEKFIDLIELIDDKEGKVLVFTPEGRFLSQDTVHLTKDGAVFFALLLKDRFNSIFSLSQS